MWHLLYKSINIDDGFLCVWFWNNNVVYATRNVDCYTTMGAITAPIVFVCNPHSNTEMNPITLVDAIPHSKQNKTRNNSDNCSDKCLTNKID